MIQQHIKLSTTSPHSVYLDAEWVPYSGLLKQLREKQLLIGTDSEGPTVLVSADDFGEAEMSKLVMYLQHYHQDPLPHILAPLRGPLNGLLPEWYMLFVTQMSPSLVIGLLKCAHFLQIESLVDLLSAHIASIANEKTTQEMEGIFLETKM